MSDSESEDYNDLELNSEDGYDTTDSEDGVITEKSELALNSEENMEDVQKEESGELLSPYQIEDIAEPLNKKIRLNRKENKFVDIIESYSRLPTSSIIHGVRLSRFSLLDNGAEPLIEVDADLKSLREVNQHILSIVDQEILMGKCIGESTQDAKRP